MKRADAKVIAEIVALNHLGTPYIWGGDDPSGFDCSGFVIEILKSVGILPSGGDWTADGLFTRFEQYLLSSQNANNGCLVFCLNEKGKATHVEYCINKKLSVGARGGGSSNQTESDAWRKNAYVKVRPFPDWSDVVFIDPFKSMEN